MLSSDHHAPFSVAPATITTDSASFSDMRASGSSKSLSMVSACRGRVATKRDSTTTLALGNPVVRPFARNVPLLAEKRLWFSAAKSRSRCSSHGSTASAGDANKIDAHCVLPFPVARADADRKLRRLQRAVIERDVREAYAVGWKRSALLDAARGFVQAQIDYAAERDAFARHLEQLALAGRATRPSARPTLPDEIWDMLHDRLEGLSHWSGISFDSTPFGDALGEDFLPELLSDASMEDGSSACPEKVNALRAAVQKFNTPSTRSRQRRKQIPFKVPASPTAQQFLCRIQEPGSMEEAIALLTNAIRLFELTDGSQASDLELALYDIIYGRDSRLELADPDKNDYQMDDE